MELRDCSAAVSGNDGRHQARVNETGAQRSPIGAFSKMGGAHVQVRNPAGNDDARVASPLQPFPWARSGEPGFNRRGAVAGARRLPTIRVSLAEFACAQPGDPELGRPRDFEAADASCPGRANVYNLPLRNAIGD